MLRIRLGLLALIFSCSVFAQVSDVLKGSVNAKEKDGIVELVGANVYWLNTQNGTITQADGSFSLPYVNGKGQLVISYIGYISDTVDVVSRDYVEVILQPDQELDEIQVSGRKAGTHISRIDPMSTVKVTGEELCKAACCNLSESFETNASVDVAYSDAATGAKQIQLLGLSGNYVQMMTENIPNFRGLATPYGLTYIPGPWMDGIQISKGTSSVINGYEALTGQINVEYKKPVNAEKFYLNLFGTDMGRAEVNTHGSIHINDKLKTAVLAHYSKDMISNDLNDDGFRDEPLLNQVNVMNRWEYNNKKGWVTQLGFKYIGEERLGGQMDFDDDVPSADLYGINIDTKRLEGFFKSGYVFDDDFTSLAIVANASKHDQNSFYGLKTYDAAQTSLYFNLIFQSYLGNENNKFSTGMSYQMDDFDEDLLIDFQHPELMTNYSRRESVPGLYFQYTYVLPEKFTLIAGVRSDFHNLYGTLFTPRLHLKYNITPNTILRASAGKGFRSPNVLAENSYLLASSRDIYITDDIEMEEAWNYGANVTQYIPVNGKELTINMEYYRTDFINQLVADADISARSISFYNLDGDSYANNFQVEAKYELLKGLDVVGAFRYNDVKTTYHGQLMKRPLISDYKGLVTLSYATPLKKWQFDYTLQMNGGGRVPSTQENSIGNQRPDSFDSYQIMNAQVTKFFRKWNVYVGAENLANFTQANPIIAGDNPFGNEFDSSLTWGPVLGRRIYFGMRFFIDRDE
ncbi:TonB-dependent receptor plug domain-containing protein [Carboxylicivirga linearis]|uniref:TonB-dependent receptor n=1 Tax=Carboxylicivirga linearis TaxID=1628157 RepID=A0ABS5JQZ7_9BACT|nr:TonB-dependent receptor [Carboxylicivirga linearis]MBS2097308.1 TonB-dependent receptor [Carboxylicivirga linearis]